MKKIIVTLLFLFIAEYSFSQLLPYGSHMGVDLQDLTGVACTLMVEADGVPFEGYTNNDGENRYDDVRYGGLQKRYYRHWITNELLSQVRAISFIRYDPAGGGRFYFASTTSLPNEPETPSPVSDFLGLTKYKFTLDIPSTGEKYIWYFDYKDSKYGKLGYLPNGSSYRRFFRFDYNSSLSVGSRLQLVELTSSYNVIETFTTSDRPDYKVWDLITRNTSFHRTTPFEEDFP